MYRIQFKIEYHGIFKALSSVVSMTSICKLERIVTLTYYLNVIKQGENVHKERTINGDNSHDACFSDSANYEMGSILGMRSNDPKEKLVHVPEFLYHYPAMVATYSCRKYVKYHVVEGLDIYMKDKFLLQI